MSSTSIGPPGDTGGNEDHGNADGLGNKTLGDHAVQQPAAGSGLLDESGAELPAGASGSRPRPGLAKEPQSAPEGSNVEADPADPEATRGKDR